MKNKKQTEIECSSVSIISAVSYKRQLSKIASLLSFSTFIVNDPCLLKFLNTVPPPPSFPLYNKKKSLFCLSFK